MNKFIVSAVFMVMVTGVALAQQMGNTSDNSTNSTGNTTNSAGTSGGASSGTSSGGY